MLPPTTLYFRQRQRQRLNVGSDAMAESHCPIGSLPPEIADRVCAKLTTPDIKSLRLVSRFWMNVATPGLFSQVHLIFTLESFQRLADISTHPIIRHHVTALFYEPDALRRYHSQKEWQNNLAAPMNTPYPAATQPGATEREQRAYRRELARQVNPPKHTQRYLRQAYAKYVRLYKEQDDLRLQHYGAAAISYALSHFPRLSMISMSLGRSIARGSSKHFDQAYAAALQKPCRDNGHDVLSGVAQMQSLLLGADLAQLQLTRLELGDVDWKFLQAPDDTLKSMKKSLKCLRSLILKIFTGCDDGEHEIGADLPECREYLENYRLNDFLIAAPGLEDLTVGFDCDNPYGPSEFKYIVGSFTWSSLRNVTFEYFDTTEEDWVAFFVRHSPTLRNVFINAVQLLSGSWVVVLERMSEVLNLEFAEFRGFLISNDPYKQWYLERTRRAGIYDTPVQGSRTREALSKFLVCGGICPLLDEEAYPQVPDR